jgi:hypothetical protein
LSIIHAKFIVCDDVCRLFATLLGAVAQPWQRDDISIVIECIDFWKPLSVDAVN